MVEIAPTKPKWNFFADKNNIFKRKRTLKKAYLIKVLCKDEFDVVFPVYSLCVSNHFGPHRYCTAQMLEQQGGRILVTF